MEHVDGLDVLQHCNELKLFTEKSAARIISQLFDAVAHCHDCGVVHRVSNCRQALARWTLLKSAHTNIMVPPFHRTSR